MNNINSLILYLLFYDGFRATTGCINDEVVVNSKELDTPTSVDLKEPNYFKALFNYFINQVMNNKLSPHEELTVAIIHQIHKEVTQDVDELNEEMESDTFQDKKSFGFSTGVFYAFSHFCDLVRKWISTGDYVFEIKAKVDSFEPAFVDSLELLENIQKAYDSIKDKHDISIQIANNLTKEQNTDLVKAILSEYNKNMSQGGLTNDDKLIHIIKMVQSLEWLHPYADANCRTFCMTLLNRELIRHDLDPALQNDPNNFDCMSIEMLVDEIKKGQEKYRTLLSDIRMIPHLKFKCNRIEYDINPIWIIESIWRLQLDLDSDSKLEQDIENKEIYYNLVSELIQNKITNDNQKIIFSKINDVIFSDSDNKNLAFRKYKDLFYEWKCQYVRNMYINDQIITTFSKEELSHQIQIIDGYKEPFFYKLSTKNSDLNNFFQKNR
ncbi:hypothetical protein L3V82_04030 [Thiotrichales bacterium 19S3-7]|nr:hypothetical protein [Thiotrichales bacterium 19S3-7]MCF6801843.1 hypothetical protein [Thiotrichales bacterium 19S3-11]